MVHLQGVLRFRADPALEDRVFFIARYLHQFVAGKVKFHAAGVKAERATAGLHSVGLTLRPRPPIGECRAILFECGLRFRRIDDRRLFPLWQRNRAFRAIQTIEIDRRRSQEKGIVVADLPVLRCRLRNMILTLTERNGATGANAGACGTEAVTSQIATKIAFHRMVTARIVAHSAVGTGRDTLAAAGATVFVDSDDAGLRVFRDCFRIDGTRPQTGRAFAVLAGDRQEIETRRLAVRKPHHPVAVLAGTEPVLLLAGSLTAFTADAALQIEHEGKPAHS